jgi:5-formyltetrahydrofolate cyclo-ligase
MARDFADKSAARQWVWDRLGADGVARFPFRPHGRIPNFAGAEVAAARLLDIEPWKSATAIKVNPDSPPRPLRAEALSRGITVFAPTPRLRGGFKKLDPRRIPPDKIEAAASLSRGDRSSEEVALTDMPRLDAIVCGSVAVTRDGRRCGKGEGYSDLEFAILRELGHPLVPVATTVHDRQIVDSVPRDSTDQPLSVSSPATASEPMSPQPRSRASWPALFGLSLGACRRRSWSHHQEFNHRAVPFGRLQGGRRHPRFSWICSARRAIPSSRLPMKFGQASACAVPRAARPADDRVQRCPILSSGD